MASSRFADTFGTRNGIPIVLGENIRLTDSLVLTRIRTQLGDSLRRKIFALLVPIQNVIELDSTEKIFGEVKALDGLNITVLKGEILGILGPNGAGKTTAIRLILGLDVPTSGSVLVHGRNPRNFGAAEKMRIGWVAQQSTADPLLTGREYLSLMAQLYDVPDSRNAVNRALETFGLSNDADRVIRGYSGGMLKRLEIAVGTVHDPDILILDEPTAALDVTTRHQLWELVRGIKKSGRTVILTTHYLDEADFLCDRLVIIDHGTCVIEGTPDQLKKQFGSSVLSELSAAVENRST